MCQSQYILYVYTHTLYIVSDLEGSDNGDPIIAHLLPLHVIHCLVTVKFTR
jgi:hypothetical protein